MLPWTEGVKLSLLDLCWFLCHTASLIIAPGYFLGLPSKSVYMLKILEKGF